MTDEIRTEEEAQADEEDDGQTAHSWARILGAPPAAARCPPMFMPPLPHRPNSDSRLWNVRSAPQKGDTNHEAST